MSLPEACSAERRLLPVVPGAATTAVGAPTATWFELTRHAWAMLVPRARFIAAVKPEAGIEEMDTAARRGWVGGVIYNSG